jgi:hypothetical protein
VGCVTMPVAATKVNNKIGYVVVHMHMTYYTCCCRRVRMCSMLVHALCICACDVRTVGDPYII